MNARQMIVEEVTDLDEIARSESQHAQFRRNAEWLESYWKDVTPQAFGKFIAVAGQEAHIAETSTEGYTWASAAHPQDHGPLVEYVLPPNGPRIYARISCGPRMMSY